MRIPFFLRKRSSSNVAKDRLKILLISDRVNCSQELMELMKNDIAKVISKYMKIDTSNMEISIAQTKGSGGDIKTPTLFANVPIIDMSKNGM